MVIIPQGKIDYTTRKNQGLYFLGVTTIIPVRLQVRLNTVIPAEAGIQTYSVHTTSLDSGFRRNDGKWEQSLFSEVP